LNPFPENRHLHFEPADLVVQKEDFLVFGAGVYDGEAFEALVAAERSRAGLTRG